MADLHQIHQIRTCHQYYKEPADGKFEDVTKEMLDGLESDTDEEDG